MKRALVMVLALTLSGCSVLFMETVPRDYAPSRAEPRCTESGGWMVWDILQTVAGVFALGYTYKNTQRLKDIDGASDMELDNAAKPYMLAFGASAVIHAGSAVVGSSNAKSCSEARKQRDAFVAAQGPAVKP